MVKTISRSGSPAESAEQRALIKIARMHRGKWPELDLLFHIPNEGKRDPVSGAMLVASGLRAGVSDLMLPVARHGYAGLFVELKRRDGGKGLTDEQLAFLLGVRAQGYKAEQCNGAAEAWELIRWYLMGEAIPRVLQPA
jgi:hypothetical protein